MRIIGEAEFNVRIREVLTSGYPDVGCVTGPGRSGAVAAVYASHILRVPFIPFGSRCPTKLGRLLIVDTATESGQTLRKAVCKYKDANPIALACFHEPPRVAFWYEAGKPQRYRHENDNLPVNDAAA